jgi:hypothetical protein
MKVHMTTHAQVRAQQRGIKTDIIDLVAIAHDICARLPGGLHALSISKQRAQELRAVFGNALVERAERLRLVVDYEADLIVTAIKGGDFHPSRHGYRRRRSA